MDTRQDRQHHLYKPTITGHTAIHHPFLDLHRAFDSLSDSLHKRNKMKVLIILALVGVALADPSRSGGFKGYGHKSGYKVEKHEVSYNKQQYHGKYGGKCDKDGFYYRDEGSFVICSNNNAYTQPCAPGTRNSGFNHYQYGNRYYSRDFCDVNLVDYGYGARHGYGYDRHDNYGYDGYRGDGYYGNSYEHNDGYGYRGDSYRHGDNYGRKDGYYKRESRYHKSDYGSHGDSYGYKGNDYGRKAGHYERKEVQYGSYGNKPY